MNEILTIALIGFIVISPVILLVICLRSNHYLKIERNSMREILNDFYSLSLGERDIVLDMISLFKSGSVEVPKRVPEADLFKCRRQLVRDHCYACEQRGSDPHYCQKCEIFNLCGRQRWEYFISKESRDE